MKTAISLPDKLFLEADQLAKKLGISRSQLYANAIAEYLSRHDAEQVMARLNAVHAVLDLQMEPGLATAQARPSSRQDAW